MTNAAQLTAKRLAMFILAICRAGYCWMFFFFSLIAMYVVCANFAEIARSRNFQVGGIWSNLVNAAYSIILATAWWTILRRKPSSKKWAITANLVYVFTYVPGMIFGNWRGVLEAEFQWWPAILIGLLGIVIFSIPHDRWRSEEGIEAATAHPQ
jgi:hypothetical protein